ncbi:MAG: V-type ATP synthase subunit I [Firmicutes bacterium]|nr:V-type ATP synthase subunit I [Bacillota bacterium]
MSLAQLKKVEIYGLQEERNRLLEEIQELGLMEVVEYTEEAQESSQDVFSERMQAEYLEQSGMIDRKIAAVGRALNFLEQIAPVKPSLIQQFAGIKTYLSQNEFERLARTEERLDQVIADLYKIEQDLSQIQSKRTQLETLAATFNPWRGLDLSVGDLEGTANTQIVLGVTEDSVDKLRETLSGLGAPYYLEVINQDQTGSYIFLVILRDSAEKALPLLTSLKVNIVSLPHFEGAIEAKLNQIEQDLLRLSQSETLLKERAASLTKERPLLQVCYDSLLSEKQRLDIYDKLAHGKRCFALKGWLVADQLNILKERLSKAKLNYVLRAEDPGPDEDTPVVLKNNPVVTPFEYLVHSFSYPQAHEVDPTPAIAPFFFIFFGIALGDAGYGLCLSLFCAGLLVALKMGPIGKRLSWMFLLSGIAAVIFGLITGSVLSLPLKFGLFSPLENPILLLIIALGLGVVQLYFGVIISAWGDIKAGRWADVIWNQGFWLLFLTSVILVLGKDAFGLGGYAKFLNYLLLFSATGVVLSAARGKKGILKKLLAIPAGLYNIYGSIGFFSDILSYSRLMALGLSGGVMGGIMNQLAGLIIQSLPVIGWFFGGLIFLIGHGLNFALSILGAYVHSSRLQYLEFFGKFYEGGGKPLTPFKMEHKYTFVINKEEA